MKSLSALINFSLIIVLFGCSYSTQAESGKEIVFATFLPENNELFKVGEEMLAVISTRMGEQIKLVSIPAKRSAWLLRNNEIHAELTRTSEYEQRVPDAIKVAEPVIEVSQHAYSTTLNFPINSWGSLKPYRLVAVRGTWVIETHMDGHNVTWVDSMVSAFQFLKSGRADLYIASAIHADRFLATTKLDVSEISRLEPAVYASLDYTFFAEKYSDIAWRYEAALKSIKADGTYEAILRGSKM